VAKLVDAADSKSAVE